MVPDTCEPTCTITTALTMPVASTASRISPRSTRAVKYWSWSDFRELNASTTASTSTPAAGRAHLRGSLFIAQRLDGVEQRRLARRVVAEEHAHRDREEGGEHHGLQRHLHGPAERAADHHRSDDPEQDAGRAADEAEHDGLAEELELDRLFRGADRDAHADLARALGDGDEHDVHDADAADD